MKNGLLLVLTALAACLASARCDYQIHVRFVYQPESRQTAKSRERARQAAVAQAEKERQREALRQKLAEIREWHRAEREQMRQAAEKKDQKEAKPDGLRAILDRKGGPKAKVRKTEPDEE